jgi:hypothetical protein
VAGVLDHLEPEPPGDLHQAIGAVRGLFERDGRERDPQAKEGIGAVVPSGMT